MPQNKMMLCLVTMLLLFWWFFISHCRFKIEEMPLFVFFTNSLTSPL